MFAYCSLSPYIQCNLPVVAFVCFSCFFFFLLFESVQVAAWSNILKPLTMRTTNSCSIKFKVKLNLLNKLNYFQGHILRTTLIISIYHFVVSTSLKKLKTRLGLDTVTSGANFFHKNHDSTIIIKSFFTKYLNKKSIKIVSISSIMK